MIKIINCFMKMVNIKNCKFIVSLEVFVISKCFIYLKFAINFLSLNNQSLNTKTSKNINSYYSLSPFQIDHKLSVLRGYPPGHIVNLYSFGHSISDCYCCVRMYYA